MGCRKAVGIGGTAAGWRAGAAVGSVAGWVVGWSLQKFRIIAS